MKKQLKIFFMTILAFAIISSAFSHCMAQESSNEQNAKNIYKSFLSEVLGIDLTKYNITNSGYGVRYPLQLGGLVKEESVSYKFDSEQSKIESWCLFDNGIITLCSVYPIEGDIIYAQTSSKNLATESQSFLQKYKEFNNKYYSRNTSYIEQMISTLKEVDSSKSEEKTIGNINLKTTVSNNTVTFRGAFTKDNIITTPKDVNWKFENGQISWFADYWNIYTISNVSPVQEKEAQSVAFNEAKNYTVTLASFEGSKMLPVEVEPDWSEMTYDSMLTMVSGSGYAGDLPAVLSTSYTSETKRDPLTLYPLWQFVFYFSEPIGNIIGVEVGVWGDTKEIAYCNAYGHLGIAPAPSTQATNQLTSDSYTQTVSTIVALAIMTTVIVLGSFIVVRKRLKR